MPKRDVKSTKNIFLESWQKKHNSIVLFAGVFDPIHSGHITAAEAALRYGSKVVFLPERIPQHKHAATAYTHRLAMIRIACAGRDDFEVLDYPEDHQLIAQTFNWLQEQYPGYELLWLVGSDVAPYIESWQGSDKLSEYGVAEILIIRRDGSAMTTFTSRVHTTPALQLTRPMKKDEHVSSSFIREDVNGRREALPEGVYEYIYENKLYEVKGGSTSSK